MVSMVTPKFTMNSILARRCSSRREMMKYNWYCKALGLVNLSLSYSRVLSFSSNSWMYLERNWSTRANFPIAVCCPRMVDLSVILVSSPCPFFSSTAAPRSSYWCSLPSLLWYPPLPPRPPRPLQPPRPPFSPDSWWCEDRGFLFLSCTS